MGLFDRFKKEVAKSVFSEKVNAEPTPVKVIENPLELQIGSSFTIGSNNHLIYRSLFQKIPEYVVVAIETFKIAPTVKGFRFYADKVDNSTIPAKSFLQILVSTRTNEIEEYRMFSKLDEFIPTNQLEWHIWYGQEGSKIGDIDAEYAGREFTRVSAWAQGDAKWVPALKFRGDFHEDNHGQIRSGVEHDAMLYGRWLNEEHEIAEYLLMSADEVTINERSKLYTSGSRQVAGVTVYGALDIAKNDIRINF